MKTQKTGRLAIMGLLVLIQILGFSAGGAKISLAEGFAANAFQQQWSQTDADVANGKVSRTFFWGLQAFAHTQEVYSESPTDTREVQYFDKGRMELTHKPGQNPDFVTNGLLVAEMVTSKIQLGDNLFVQHFGANIPVAGDPEGYANTPTYRNFDTDLNQPGQNGSSGYGDRTGGLVDQFLTRDQLVSPPPPLPTNVKYAKYIPNTRHNIADVFYNFFQSAPLGEDKWLPVMGFPISEAYWFTATVTGKNQLVMAQMFERRALTYTPSNPGGFQVEMANVGQHYYQWRYGTTLHNDNLPGNYRVLLPQGKSLFSSSIHQAEIFKVADAPNNITGLWPSSRSLAIVDAGQSVQNFSYVSALYFAPLDKASQFTALPINPDITNPKVEAVNWTTDGSRATVVFSSRKPTNNPTFIDHLLYDKTVVQDYFFVGANFIATTTAFDEAFDPKGGYGGIAIGPTIFSAAPDGTLALYDTNRFVLIDTAHGYKTLHLPSNINIYHILWSNDVNGMILQFLTNDANNKLVAKIGRYSYDCQSGSCKYQLLEETLNKPGISDMSLSPDGNIVAVLYGSDTYSVGVIFMSWANFITGGTVANSVDLPVTVASYSGTAFPRFAGWSADSSYLTITSSSSGAAGERFSDLLLVAPINGKILNINHYDNNDNNNGEVRQLMAPFYVLDTYYQNVSFNSEQHQKLSIKNVDGSDDVTLFASNDSSYQLDLAKVIQIPQIK